MKLHQLLHCFLKMSMLLAGSVLVLSQQLDQQYFRFLPLVNKTHTRATGIAKIIVGLYPDLPGEGGKYGKEEGRNGQEQEEREREEGKEKGDGGKEVEVNVLPTLSTIRRRC